MSIQAQVESGMDDIYETLIDKAKKRKLRDTVAEFIVFSLLKRVADQAKNICDQTVFAVSGKIKPARHFQILFVDGTNGWQSWMAQEIARKRFPESASYASAATRPDDETPPDVPRFLEERGIAISGGALPTVDSMSEALPAYDIVVFLDVTITDVVPPLPFHTSALRWHTRGRGESAGTAATMEQLEETYRFLSIKIEELMQLLAGAHAD
jgi:protein-tyrosine-phosphatase